MSLWMPTQPLQLIVNLVLMLVNVFIVLVIAVNTVLVLDVSANMVLMRVMTVRTACCEC